jgi:hypothetical protein
MTMATWGYNFFICLETLIILRNPFGSKKHKFVFYHLITWVASVGFVVYSANSEIFGLSVFLDASNHLLDSRITFASFKGTSVHCGS